MTVSNADHVMIQNGSHGTWRCDSGPNVWRWLHWDRGVILFVIRVRVRVCVCVCACTPGSTWRVELDSLLVDLILRIALVLTKDLQ